MPLNEIREQILKGMADSSFVDLIHREFPVKREKIELVLQSNGELGPTERQLRLLQLVLNPLF